MGNDCCRGRQASSGRKGSRAFPMIRGIGVLVPLSTDGAEDGED
jgi:hypothetical protein